MKNDKTRGKVNVYWKPVGLLNQWVTNSAKGPEENSSGGHNHGTYSFKGFISLHGTTYGGNAIKL